MAQINISKALKLKNKLVSDINKEWQKVVSYNSVITGANRPFSIENSYKKVEELKSKLVELKTKIHLANAPVYNIIFAMSELKELAKALNSLSCDQGPVTDPYRRSETPLVYSTIIDVVAKEEKLAFITQRIEEMQEVLEKHNVTTEIEFEL